MTDPIRLYRLWRTSGIMCTLGALEFGYLAYVRQTWWPLIVTVLLLVVAGLAFRRIRAPRQP
jgi:hypothetical protein